MDLHPQVHPLKKATAYKRGERVVLHASSRTTDGVWVLEEPCVELGLDCTDEELGATARRVLGGSRDGVAHPSDWADWGRVLEPLLAAAGVRSWSNFAKTATCIELEEKDGALFLVPTVNLGAADGFEPQDALKLECTMGEDGAAGAAIKRLLR